ncbi:2-succinylbenzoate--CoA ligase [Calothrix sp. 336/3]|uniref:2-succinylbenzoate--CoA ligase n=1 Tax=Calothrix sp. 336/3 TaxID=1337936 RepID=UPI0004E2A3B2|nr:2-succinylbenzoate--CoA ligase [Calothrix sp. 336/3]AKG22312.1 O-succinylbenzoic acid--CoA ligase [Calothrix sp. 336/3]
MVRSLVNRIDKLNQFASSLICAENHLLPEYVQSYYQELKIYNSQGISPQIILAEKNPVRFLAGFLAANMANCNIFLGNYDWGEREWEQVVNLVEPDIIWGIDNREIPQKRKEEYIQRNQIMIPTGGSSGKIKFAVHTWETLTASVQGFQEYFQTAQVNSVCTLPLYHVSGLMQFMRSFLTGGKLVILPGKNLELHSQDYQFGNNFFISLVPTQLGRILQNLELTNWLSQFNTVLVGGAATNEELLTKAREKKISIALTYGMTETASQIVTLKPEDFLAGNNSVGKVLPHAKVTIHPQTKTISIQSQSLTLGYYPLNTHISPSIWHTDDMGFWDERGYLHIIGRNSDKIITGGENVYPVEIESVIRDTGMVQDVCVVGIPNLEWGQVITAIYTVNHFSVSEDKIKSSIQNKLSRFKIPKYWLLVDEIPRNAQGKVNRGSLESIAKELIERNN